MLPKLLEHILLHPSWGETEFIFAELMIKSLLEEGGDATIDLAFKIQQRLTEELRRNYLSFAQIRGSVLPEGA